MIWGILIIVVVFLYVAVSNQKHNNEMDRQTNLENDDYLDSYLRKLIEEEFQFCIKNCSSYELEQYKTVRKNLIKKPRFVLMDEDGEEIERSDEEAIKEIISDYFSEISRY